MEEFRALIDWCRGESLRVVSALVYRYDHTRALGAWSGFLAYAPDEVARFDGMLPSLSRDACRDGTLEVSLRVRAGDAWARLGAESWVAQLPLADVSVRNGILEAVCQTARAEHRFTCFLQAERRGRSRDLRPPTFRSASRLS